MPKALGIEGELAVNQFAANKKSLRTAIVSLSLCLILIASYVNIIAIYNLAESKNDELAQYDMTLKLHLLNKILLLEGLAFALSPLGISLPCVLAICWYMLELTMTTWAEFVAIFPGGAILLYTGCIFAAIVCAYWVSSKAIKQGNIIEAIKNEVV